MKNSKVTTSKLLPRVIVCMDIKNSRVVKGVNFKQLKDMGDPIELAQIYEAQGADELVFLDIAATPEKTSSALKLVALIAKNLSIPFTVGGGLKSLDDVKSFLDAGADKVSLNSYALENPSIINQTAQLYGRQCMVVAVDVLRDAKGYTIYSHGGSHPHQHDLKQWVLEVADRGASEILLTAMHMDGVGLGFDCELTSMISEQVTIAVIASGGASGPLHFKQAFNHHIDACLAAGMFHSGRYSVGDVKYYLRAHDIQVRASI